MTEEQLIYQAAVQILLATGMEPHKIESKHRITAVEQAMMLHETLCGEMARPIANGPRLERVPDFERPRGALAS